MCAIVCREPYNWFWLAISSAVRALVPVDCMPRRILIADDNAIFRKALRRLIEGAEHWEIVEAHGGEEAVTKSVETRPDVIVLDLAMPDKDGLAAAREISALLPDTPILMCTMHNSPHIESEAQKSGIRTVLSKANSSLLLPAIRQLLRAELPSSEAADPETILPSAVALNPIPPAPLSATEVPAEPVPPSLPKSVA
jgi:DNA-binding NarL/FixJ family response regulator